MRTGLALAGLTLAFLVPAQAAYAPAPASCVQAPSATATHVERVALAEATKVAHEHPLACSVTWDFEDLKSDSYLAISNLQTHHTTFDTDPREVPADQLDLAIVSAVRHELGHVFVAATQSTTTDYDGTLLAKSDGPFDVKPEIAADAIGFVLADGQPQRMFYSGTPTAGDQARAHAVVAAADALAAK